MAGRIIRQGRMLACLFLSVAMLIPAVSFAQDVVVLSPPTDAASDAPTPIPVIVAPDVASTDTATAAPPVVTPNPNAKFLQCTTDADCVLLDDNCKSLTVVNQGYIAAANAGATLDEVCHAAAASPLNIKTVCRNGWCGLLPGRMP